MPVGEIKIEGGAMKIGRYDKHSDGNFHLAKIIETDNSPYWRVENGKVFYIFFDRNRSLDNPIYTERAKQEMCLSEEEAIKNDCHCYYKIIGEAEDIKKEYTEGGQ